MLFANSYLRLTHLKHTALRCNLAKSMLKSSVELHEGEFRVAVWIFPGVTLYDKFIINCS